jgi:hypothetical protein
MNSLGLALVVLMVLNIETLQLAFGALNWGLGLGNRVGIFWFGGTVVHMGLVKLSDLIVGVSRNE